MGMIVYPVFRAPTPATKPRTSGEFLAREFDVLDEIAEDYGLTPFTSFTDQRRVPLDFIGPAWELRDTIGPCEDWFPAAAGQAAFTALARLIRATPEASTCLGSPVDVAEELEDLA